MATDSIAINVSDNTEQISLTVTAADSSATYSSSEGSPYYVGAEIDVERVTNGVKITATDKEGATSATVYDGAKGDKGDKGDAGITIYSNTTAGWSAQTTLVSEEGAFYIYTDHDYVGDTPIAGFKIGDGLAYVVDLPFLDANMQSHMSNEDIHVTAEEKVFWNNKNRGLVEGENLILTIN